VAAKVQTYNDLQRWLRTLSPAQLAAPILATGGADDYGLTEYVFAVELVDVAHEHPQISGGYGGPVMLVQELVGKPAGSGVQRGRRRLLPRFPDCSQAEETEEIAIDGGVTEKNVTKRPGWWRFAEGLSDPRQCDLFQERSCRSFSAQKVWKWQFGMICASSDFWAVHLLP